MTAVRHQHFIYFRPTKYQGGGISKNEKTRFLASVQLNITDKYLDSLKYRKEKALGMNIIPDF